LLASSFFILQLKKKNPIMKKFLASIALVLVTGFAVAQSTPLTVTFKFVHIVEGYDHECKSVVYVDGEQVGESKEAKESVGTSFTVQVPNGSHDIKVMNFAYYEGEWEEHTVENEYSIDCVFEESGREFSGKAQKLYLVHDIDAKTYYSWKKALKTDKKTGGIKVPKGQE
jgi:hypothetical protein